jgi:hypothetical protein
LINLKILSGPLAEENIETSGGRKWQEAGEHSITRSFVTCTLHHILLVLSYQGG